MLNVLYNLQNIMEKCNKSMIKSFIISYFNHIKLRVSVLDKNDVCLPEHLPKKVAFFVRCSWKDDNCKEGEEKNSQINHIKRLVKPLERVLYMLTGRNFMFYASTLMGDNETAMFCYRKIIYNACMV